MRALTETETADYLAGHRGFPGAVETPEGIVVPEGAWVVGSNMPGYMPDGDPYAVADWFDGWAILRGDLERYAEQDDDLWMELDCGHTSEDDHDSECYGSTRALVDAILADGEREGAFEPNQDVEIGVADNEDRPRVFFLVWSPDSDPDED